VLRYSNTLLNLSHDRASLSVLLPWFRAAQKEAALPQLRLSVINLLQ